MTKYMPPLRWTAAALTVLSLTGLTTAAAATGPASPVAQPSSSSHSRTPDLTAAPDVIATDVQMPWGMAFLPGGNALITERQTSRVLRIGPGRGPEPVRTIPDVYLPGGDGGLLGLDLGLAWDARGRMYSAEFGEDAFDEINLIRPGRNYGWPMVEGTGDTDDGRLTNPPITFPTTVGPSGIAISGNTLYMAGLTGRQLVTMPLVKGRIGEPTVYFTGVYGRLRTVETAPDGALWLTTSHHPRQPREGDDHVLRFPTR